jgi:hypothetical protein
MPMRTLCKTTSQTRCIAQLRREQTANASYVCTTNKKHKESLLLTLPGILVVVKLLHLRFQHRIHLHGDTYIL